MRRGLIPIAIAAGIYLMLLGAGAIGLAHLAVHAHRIRAGEAGYAAGWSVLALAWCGFPLAVWWTVRAGARHAAGLALARALLGIIAIVVIVGAGWVLFMIVGWSLGGGPRAADLERTVILAIVGAAVAAELLLVVGGVLVWTARPRPAAKL